MPSNGYPVVTGNGPGLPRAARGFPFDIQPLSVGRGLRLTSREKALTMRLFQCQACRNIVYFENNTCERCHHRLGFLPETQELSALEPSGDAWSLVGQTGTTRRFCANASHDACNWLTPPGSEALYCLACQHNHIILNLSNIANLIAWRRMESAKHRLVYSLLRWKLPMANRGLDPEHGLEFNFPADATRTPPRPTSGTHACRSEQVRTPRFPRTGQRRRGRAQGLHDRRN